MKKLFLLISMLFSTLALAQTATPIRTVSVLPAFCQGGQAGVTTDTVVLAVGGFGTQYTCTKNNTWVPTGGGISLIAPNTFSASNTFSGSNSVITMPGGDYFNNSGLFLVNPITFVGQATVFTSTFPSSNIVPPGTANEISYGPGSAGDFEIALNNGGTLYGPANPLLVPVGASLTNGHCLSISSNQANFITVQDSGAACSSGLSSSGYITGSPIAQFNGTSNIISPLTSYAPIVALFGSSCSGFLNSNGTCSTSVVSNNLVLGSGPSTSGSLGIYNTGGTVATLSTDSSGNLTTGTFDVNALNVGILLSTGPIIKFTGNSLALGALNSVLVNATGNITLGGGNGANSLAGNVTFNGANVDYYSQTIGENQAGTLMYIGAPSGYVSTNGTTITSVLGTPFVTTWTGTIVINGVAYTIGTVSNTTTMTVSPTAGTQTTVPYWYNGGATVDHLGNLVVTSCTGCGAPTLSNLSGATTAATLTESALGDIITFAGKETGQYTYPYVYSNTLGGALLVSGHSSLSASLIVNQADNSGADILDLYYLGAVAAGVFTPGQLMYQFGYGGTFTVGAQNYSTIGGSVQISGSTTGASNPGKLTICPTGSSCTTPSASITGPMLALGSSGVSGSVVFGNATSGLLTLQTVTGALGTVAMQIPIPVGLSTLAQTVQAGTYLLTSLGSSVPATTCINNSSSPITATGVLTNDVINFTPNARLGSFAGFTPVSSGGLTVDMYPTVGGINVELCNWSTGPITVPTGLTLNYRVSR